MENANNRLIVALDSKEILESKSLVSKLKNKVSFYKIGLRTFVIDGFNLVDEIKEYGKKVFLDLKLYDIKSTIQETVARISEHDIDFLTESLDLLDDLIDARGIKDEELDVIGELMSNILGAKEVFEDIKSGMDEKEALNKFMKKVTSVGK